MGYLGFFTLEFYELVDLGTAFHSRPNLRVIEELLYPDRNEYSVSMGA